MSILLHSVANGIKPQEEFVWLMVGAKTSLKGYAVVDRTFDSAEKVSNEFRHIFIFPDIEVEKDDWVALCTGKGEYFTKKTQNGLAKIHFLYWQSDQCVWNDKGGDTASLIKYSFVNSVKVPAVKK
ncbi:hypothetical protein [Flavobacterium sp. SORGH_AS_0622]|uniref:hypothetical protein n=1 Tax=Flavobacterium sp. SORGH_AS_0622 TaxID=3041772 RepID=UPI002788D537|nr:hypothetical protein [Flavobacterium sp. SORGH_AS_0622]MDQ1164623.1 hypothetical protein [Flavobacterium sp. SORGH_AS_0622]